MDLKDILRSDRKLAWLIVGGVLVAFFLIGFMRGAHGSFGLGCVQRDQVVTDIVAANKEFLPPGMEVSVTHVGAVGVTKLAGFYQAEAPDEMKPADEAVLLSVPAERDPLLITFRGGCLVGMDVVPVAWLEAVAPYVEPMVADSFRSTERAGDGDQ